MMNREDVIRWMHEVGAKESNPTPQTYEGFVVLFQHFAKLAAEWAAKQERDECVKVCEEQAKALSDHKACGAEICADAIRARGQ